MKQLSVIIITRNEENHIAACVKHAAEFAHEVIVIDNGSTDTTAKVAEAAGAAVTSVPGLDFSYMRNVGKEQAHGPWLLYLDTDERLSDQLIKEVRAVISAERSEAAYTCYRHNYFFGKRWPKSDTMIRLIRKDALLGWQGVVHETAQVTGEVGALSAPLLHHTHNTITDMVAKTNEWSEIESQLRYKSNHPKMTWWRFFRVMLTAFWSSYIRDGGWKAGTVGLVESLYQAFSMFITYAKLWEKQTAPRKRHERPPTA